MKRSIEDLGVATALDDKSDPNSNRHQELQLIKKRKTVRRTARMRVKMPSNKFIFSLKKENNENTKNPNETSDGDHKTDADSTIQPLKLTVNLQSLFAPLDVD
ncbi:hypothetical protein PanWU01x14_209040 [Parasponia andersonii]|uniref:Uncharacterized protein n=1 Tax=Parasponia andersonii TaxID=3476 RepID=A0A2P5BUP5_PARAD|nr:hypothetical protein PanWU01x14_209040 [Parasponia andersonii]